VKSVGWPVSGRHHSKTADVPRSAQGTLGNSALPGSSGAAIAFDGLCHRFVTAEDETPVLEDISLSVAPGELLAIVGPSGCGKTTLLNLLAGLEEPQQGSVTLFGAPPQTGSGEVGYLFARDSLLPWRTALENVCVGMQLRGVRRDQREERARSLLKAVGLGGFEGAYRAQLSQGMRQRVALARTLALEPRLLLMDEPFSALDAQTRLQVQETFLSLWERVGATVILITHDLSEAVALADRVVIMTRRPGRVKAVFSIKLARPRDLRELQSDSTYLEHYAAIWGELKSEFSTPDFG